MSADRALLDALVDAFDVDASVADAARRACDRLPSDTFENTSARVRAKILRAFAETGLAESDLAGTLGYGYGDAARAGYEALLARVLDAQAVLARLSFVSGTHAIVTALDALVPRDGTLLVVTGRPYDTLRAALCDAPYSLVARGVRYVEVPLRLDGTPDPDAIARAAGGVDVAFVQRSRGYAARASLSARACGELAAIVRDRSPGAVTVVDDCYGELVEETEPTAHGVDAIAGSLIKNLGGGIAPGGGYVAGRAEVVERVAARHTAPGLGAAVGSTLGFGRALVQGLYAAPLAIAEALRGLDFFAALFCELGYAVDPAPGAVRRDIVQAIRLGQPSLLLAFARGLQRSMPLDARFAPEPGAVPGYAEPVVMSAGAFVPGSTLELSCDAPLREPFDVYVQGGTTRAHGMLGALFAAEAVRKESKSAPARERRMP